LWARLAQR